MCSARSVVVESRSGAASTVATAGAGVIARPLSTPSPSNARARNIKRVGAGSTRQLLRSLLLRSSAVAVDKRWKQDLQLVPRRNPTSAPKHQFKTSYHRLRPRRQKTRRRGGALPTPNASVVSVLPTPNFVNEKPRPGVNVDKRIPSSVHEKPRAGVSVGPRTLRVENDTRLRHVSVGPRTPAYGNERRRRASVVVWRPPPPPRSPSPRRALARKPSGNVNGTLGVPTRASNASSWTGASGTAATCATGCGSTTT